MSRAHRVHFPSFLLTSLPFRRRRTSSDSTASTASTSLPTSPTTTSSGAPPPGEADYLGRHVSYLRCSRCAVDLCLTSAIVSRGFTGRWGRAYLVSSAGSTADPNVGPAGPPPAALPNTHVHRPVPRQLVTGAHTVSDVSCAFCGSVLGWKYVAADEESQRYKVGKFILETKRVSVATDWEHDGRDAPDPQLDDEGFDSQDEDECEELFAGTWTAGAAAGRRAARRFGTEVV